MIKSAFALDWRNAFRSLRAAPVVTAIAVLSVALGIGANTALFSLINGLILKPLKVQEPERLVLLADGSWTNPIWEQIRAREQICSTARLPGRINASTSRSTEKQTSSMAPM